MRDSAVSDLTAPDSPTMPEPHLERTEKLTSFHGLDPKPWALHLHRQSVPPRA